MPSRNWWPSSPAPPVSASARGSWRALAALGRPDEAIAYAEASRGLNVSPMAIAVACEEILLTAGRVEEAYRRYALVATRGTSYLATYRALARKYPRMLPEQRSRGAPGQLLADLVDIRRVAVAPIAPAWRTRADISAPPSPDSRSGGEAAT
jgi:hypothetical protein